MKSIISKKLYKPSYLHLWNTSHRKSKVKIFFFLIATEAYNSLLVFPSEVYNISNQELGATRTTSISAQVINENYVLLSILTPFQDLETENSSIASRIKKQP